MEKHLPPQVCCCSDSRLRANVSPQSLLACCCKVYPVKADRAFPSVGAVRPKSKPARRCSLAGLSPAEGRPLHTGAGPLWHLVPPQSGHLGCSPLTALGALVRSVQGSLGLRRRMAAMVVREAGLARLLLEGRTRQPIAHSRAAHSDFSRAEWEIGIALKQQKNLFQAGFAVETLLNPAVPALATASSTGHKVRVLSGCPLFVCPAKEQLPGCKTCRPHRCHSLFDPPHLHH